MALKDESAPLPKALEALLGDTLTDEKTGANATLGFTFQQWWGRWSWPSCWSPKMTSP